jgi:hypothetical protein
MAVIAFAFATTRAQASSLGRPCTEAPVNQYLPAAQLQIKAEAQGYTVERVKVAKACAEIYAVDKTGAKVELFLDPTNGTIVSIK